MLKSGAATSVNAPVPLNNTINFLGIDNTGRAVISGRSSSTTPDTRFVLRGDGSSTLTTILDNTAAYAGVQGGGFYSFGGGVVSATGDAIAFNAVHDPGPSAADTGSYFFNTTTAAISTIQDEDSHPDAEYSFELPFMVSIRSSVRERLMGFHGRFSTHNVLFMDGHAEPITVVKSDFARPAGITYNPYPHRGANWAVFNDRR